MSIITDVLAREVLDSRGSLLLKLNCIRRWRFRPRIVPSGASTGEHEPLNCVMAIRIIWQAKGV